MFNGTNSSIQLNAGTAATGDAGNLDPGGIAIGGNSGGAYTTDMDCAELMMFSRVLDARELALVRNYINARLAVY